jgi:hypothetical protein
MSSFNEVSMNAILVVLSGLFLRLVLPILATALAVLVLRTLSKSWQIRGEKDMLCWQIHRLPNGYLKEECLNCDVFISAPITVEKLQMRKHIN